MPDLDPTQTTGANPAGAVPGATAVPVAPVVAPVSPTPAAPVAPPNLAIDPETGKSWQQLYYESKSQVGRLEQQLSSAQAQSGAQVEGLTTQVTDYQTAVTQLNANIQSLTTTAAQVPDLEEQVTSLKAEAALGRKYQAAVKHPNLLSIKVKQQVDGQEEPVEVSPIMTLLESTDLAPDAFELVMQQMDAAFASQPPSASVATQAPTAPPAATPVAQDTPEWRAGEIERVHGEMIAHPENLAALTEEYLKLTAGT